MCDKESSSNSPESLKGHFTITVKTRDLKFSGTNNNVTIVLIDENGDKSKDLTLNNPCHDDFESGREDEFKFTDLNHLKKIRRIHIHRSGCVSDDWFVDYVMVLNHGTGAKNIFPVHRWIPFEKKIEITEYDSILPQDDPNIQARKEELDKRRLAYKMSQKQPNFPPQTDEVPLEENFSDEYKFDIQKRKVKFMVHSKITQMLTEKWESLEEIKNIFDDSCKIFPFPENLENWSSDEHFARQRTQCCNPNQLRLISEIPDKFAVTEDMVKPFLDGKTLKEALKENRFFMVDHDILVDIPKTDEGRSICAPMALFYKGTADNIKPVAIQLNQKPAKDNPVFLPSDPPNTWILAKMWFNCADSAVHQSITHLGLTHIFTETICVSINRNLSPSHPIYRLLAPHFLYLISINSLAVAKLVSPGGWVDQGISVGRIGMYELIGRKFPKYRLDTHLLLPKELESRGVLSTDVLPDYPYRDDGLLLYDAIREYVTTVVDYVYGKEDKLQADWELQAWIKELGTPISEGGCGFQGVPGNGQADLCDLLTGIIFNCSAGHAAVNFTQYDAYAFPPNYPATLRGKPPTSKDPIDEQVLLDTMPSKSAVMDVMLVTKILSERATQPLADFEIPYVYEPEGIKALEQLRKRLKDAEEIMKNRNKERQVPYTVLYPSEIPNAVSI